MDSPYPPTPYRRSRKSHASNPSWISNSIMQPSAHPWPGNSSRPLPQPTHSRGLSASSQWQSERLNDYASESAAPERDETGGDLEAQLGEDEAMGQAMDGGEGEGEGEVEGEDEEWGTPESTDHITVPEGAIPAADHSPQRGRARAFVGGFVTGLRNLPRLMVKTERRALRKGAPELYAAQDPEALPAYDDPSQPVPGPSNVHYVQAMEMPSEHVASSQMSYAVGDSQDRPVQILPEYRNEEPPPQNSATRPPLGLSSPAVGTPVLVEPRPTRDYAKMESPIRTAPPDDSFSAHITRIHNFIVELKNLPWVSSRVTVDYFPEKSGRARDPKIKPGSWYSTPQHHEIDLLATPAAAKAEVPRSDDGQAVVRPVRTATMTSCSSSPVPSAFRQYAASLASQGLSSPVTSLRSHRRRSSYRSYHHRSSHSGYQLPHMSQLGNIQLAQNGLGVTVDAQGNQMIMVPVASIPSMPSMPSPPPASHSPSHPPTHVFYPSMSSPSNPGDYSKLSLCKMDALTARAANLADELIRSDFWFNDGNIILVVRGIAFKVHRGQLERHSEIFRDLFSMPQPPDQVLLDGCQWLELYDSPSDVLHLLSALYDGLYITKPCAIKFDVISGVLRLSNKYLIDHLRIRCLQWLRADWPSSLEGWDRRELQATDDNKRYAPRESYPHPIRIINLARELALDDLLPSALYDLSRYGPRKIAAGTTTVPCPAPTSASVASNALDERICLSPQELYTALLGRECGQRYIASFIEKELSGRPVSPTCINRHRDNGRPCRESFYFIMLNILRSVGGISAGRDADPLFTLVQAIEMLSRKDFTDGEKQCGLQICEACKIDFAQSAAKARQDVWAQLPSWFGFGTHATAPIVSKTC
ncbi:uncharacterized protein C8Q71DRAFT_717556 [Rhodofomes roseus]|uniref:BTB domain-containing protein n=1 Tax=Rhodofomes roseus TaxID=34475 RepID=A0ABQ8K045_9APHY|nr:uncharacterized protein C8Q71DRAFT_717556 [Rhodofomes roseus]KAH9830003.1 hypothetical protein C8Q71DRAFT_717556 [Rhodofomes roseus]